MVDTEGSGHWNGSCDTSTRSTEWGGEQVVDNFAHSPNIRNLKAIGACKLRDGHAQEHALDHAMDTTISWGPPPRRSDKNGQP